MSSSSGQTFAAPAPAPAAAIRSPAPIGALQVEAAQALNVLMMMQQGGGQPLAAGDLRPVVEIVARMAQHLAPAVDEHFDAGGVSSRAGFRYAHPANVAALAMAIGASCGFDRERLTAVGVTAALMNVGYVALRSSALLDNTSAFEDEQWVQVRLHPEKSRELLEGAGLSPEMLEAIAQHHERWDGSGYPAGLRGDQIALYARIVAICDTYASLRAARPHRPPMGPRAALDFVMAGSGTLFDPELVAGFARRVPQYPAGARVRLSGGESGVVVHANIGHICRPVVRITAAGGVPVQAPYEIDLSERAHYTNAVLDDSV